MIIATVRYKLPAHIDREACRAHYHKIASSFLEVKGFIGKQFIWNESGWAGGVYQWETLEDAQHFFGPTWRSGVVQRYGMEPEIEYYDCLAVVDKRTNTVEPL